MLSLSSPHSLPPSCEVRIDEWCGLTYLVFFRIALLTSYYLPYPLPQCNLPNCIIIILIFLLVLDNIVFALLPTIIALILPIFWCVLSTISDTENSDQRLTKKIKTETDKLLYIQHTKMKVLLSIRTHNHKHEFNNFLAYYTLF